MNILLNDKKLNFTLENEKNLGEIIKGVETWLHNSDLIITSVKISERELLSEITDAWKNTPIDDIKELSLTVKPMSEVQRTSLENIVHFLTMLKEALLNRDSVLLKELSHGYPFMIESLTLLIKRVKSGSLKNQSILFINRFPRINEQVVSSWAPEEKEQAYTLIDALLKKLMEIIDEMRNPFKTIQKLTENIKTSIQDISEVSILLQTGKDREAMNTLVVFSDTLQDFLRVFLLLKNSNNIDIKGLTISDMSFEEYYNELNSVLKELIDAFHINDSVLIGDLLEYEIAPRLEGLIQFIKRLKVSEG
ncbi:MAG: hypothetical protein JXB88_04145 [Spirochaetales bacterium]|nr:hypothetical protein [Spirochaetales bacterium]